jgi:hypothetical protein
VLELSQQIGFQNHELSKRHYEALLVQVAVEKVKVNVREQILNVLAQEQVEALDFQLFCNDKD